MKSRSLLAILALALAMCLLTGCSEPEYDNDTPHFQRSEQVSEQV